jgi:hypothetical protein
MKELRSHYILGRKNHQRGGWTTFETVWTDYSTGKTEWVGRLKIYASLPYILGAHLIPFPMCYRIQKAQRTWCSERCHEKVLFLKKGRKNTKFVKRKFINDGI